jgi:hypothetical protein
MHRLLFRPLLELRQSHLLEQDFSDERQNEKCGAARSHDWPSGFG